MARFYDVLNDSKLKLVEELLKKGGIAYTLRVLEDDTTLSKLTKIKEIQVAEEDMAAAEQAISGSSLFH